jgi:hypothetical protein
VVDPKSSAAKAGYDPQLQVHTSMSELVGSVSLLEARLAVLEQREGNGLSPVITETQERE